MVRNIGTGTNNYYNTKNIKPEKQTKEEAGGPDAGIKDCYKKLSPRDVPRMKGDWGPRLRESYMRWDKDLQAFDKREKGSLKLRRRDTKAKTLAKTYREFCNIATDITLGSLRGFYGTVGITAIRKAIRENGIPKEFHI